MGFTESGEIFESLIFVGINTALVLVAVGRGRWVFSLKCG